MKYHHNTKGERIYTNDYGVSFCSHPTVYENGEPCERIKVVCDWGNTSYLCRRCGEVVKKDLMPTA